MASGKDCAIKVCKSTLGVGGDGVGSVGVKGSLFFSFHFHNKHLQFVFTVRPQLVQQLPVVSTLLLPAVFYSFSKQVFPSAEGQNNLFSTSRRKTFIRKVETNCRIFIGSTSRMCVVKGLLFKI